MTFLRKEWDWDVKRSVGHKTLQGSSGGEEERNACREQELALHERQEPFSQIGEEDSYTQIQSRKTVGLCRGLGGRERKIWIMFFKIKGNLLTLIKLIIGNFLLLAAPTDHVD